MNEGTGLRERKKAATRAALAEAALRLAAERGPGTVTVEEISEAAGLSPRTFFNHFASKEDAILGIDPNRLDVLAERLRARPVAEAPLEALWAALVAESVSLDEEAEAWGVRMQLVREHDSLLRRHNARFAEVERVLVEAVAARTGADPEHDLEPWLVVGAALTAMRIASTRWRSAGGGASLRELLDHAFDRLARGLDPAWSPTLAAPAAP